MMRISRIGAELRPALRSLARSPAFTAAAVATLALGIGGNVTIFTVVERVVLRSLPFPEPERLVRVRDTLQAADGQVYTPNVLPYRCEALERGLPALESVAGQRAETVTLLSPEGGVTLQAAAVTAGAFELLGVAPRLGRAFTAQESRLGTGSGSAVVSDRLWRERLGGSPAILRRALPLADRTLTVVGVMPPGYRFPYGADVWEPLALDAADLRDLVVIGRLAPGASLETARAQAAALARRLDREGPVAGRGRGFRIAPLKQDLLQDQQGVPLALMAAVGSLLLLACGNLASLLLARSITRQREMAIRAALGATRLERARQSLAESVLLALAGGGLGLLLSHSGVALVGSLVPPLLDDYLRIGSPDSSAAAAGFALALTAATAALFGFLPAWRSSRADPASVLAGAGRASTLSAGNRRLLGAFVVGEIALAVLLTGAAVAMVADWRDRAGRSPGLSPTGLAAVELSVREAGGGSPDGADRARLVDRVLESVRAIPGVVSAAATTTNPFEGTSWGVRVTEGSTVDPTTELPTVSMRIATPGLFRAFETPLLAGRDFTDADRAGAAPVAIVGRHLARRFWGTQSPLGRAITRRAPDGSYVPMTVVGVVEEVTDRGLLADSIYLPYAQLAGHEAAETVHVMVRRRRASAVTGSELARAVAAVDPRIGLASIAAMDDLYARTLTPRRLGSQILSFLGGFGLLLAAVGIAAVVSFFALQRRTELGIRAAIGATPGQIRGLVLRQGLALATSGCGIGLVLALAANRGLAHAVEDMAPRPSLCAMTAALLFAVALLAADVPARRAAAADPLETLRHG
jgi:putative ABC transport system permease protein